MKGEETMSIYVAPEIEITVFTEEDIIEASDPDETRIRV